MHNSQFAQTVRTYDRIAPLYDLIDGIYEHSWKARLRAALFAHARGRILDVGVGTGCNIPFYPEGSKVVGIDMSERMLDKARDRARELGRPMTLRPMNLLSLDFPDASFDTVSCTFVLLCLPDELQEQALRELRRVTRPDGRVLILDYRRSAKAGLRFLRQCLKPWLRWAFAATGCRRCMRRARRSAPSARRPRANTAGAWTLACTPARPTASPPSSRPARATRAMR